MFKLLPYLEVISALPGLPSIEDPFDSIVEVHHDGAVVK